MLMKVNEATAQAGTPVVEAKKLGLTFADQ